jgi:hypothetical protein
MSNKHLYLVANYYMKPQFGVNTTRAGWSKDPEKTRYDETVSINRGLKPKHLAGAGIVLNLSTKTVERNQWRTGASFNDLFKYFFKGYHGYITQVMSKLDPVYFNEMLDELQREHDAMHQEEAEVVNTEEEKVTE